MLVRKIVLAACAVTAIATAAQAQTRDQEKDNWARTWAAGKQTQGARENMTCSGDRCVHTLSWEANNIMSGAKETTVMRVTIGGAFATREICNVERAREATCVDDDDSTTRTYIIAADGWHLLTRPAHTQDTDRQNDENWKRQWNAGRRRAALEQMTCLGGWCWNTLSYFTSKADGSVGMTILRETLDGNLLVRRESCSRQFDAPVEWDVTCVDIDHGVGECRYKIMAQDDWRLIGARTVAAGHSQDEALAACANGVAQIQ